MHVRVVIILHCRPAVPSFRPRPHRTSRRSRCPTTGFCPCLVPSRSNICSLPPTHRSALTMRWDPHTRPCAVIIHIHARFLLEHLTFMLCHYCTRHPSLPPHGSPTHTSCTASLHERSCAQVNAICLCVDPHCNIPIVVLRHHCCAKPTASVPSDRSARRPSARHVFLPQLHCVRPERNHSRRALLVLRHAPGQQRISSSATVPTPLICTSSGLLAPSPRMRSA
jgi:hypothetical protein